jgi:uncharacterized protein YcaQ
VSDTVSPRAVAALFLERQGLERPRARRLTGAALQAFVERTCGLQIDSVNVIDRAHHLTLWSRFGPYDRRALERLIYKKRLLLEYLSHVACFVSVNDLPIWRGMMAGVDSRWAKRHGDPWKKMPAGEVLQRIGEADVLGVADFERPASHKGGDGWWSWKPAQHALDYLWKTGRIAVHSRVHFHRRYALMERVLPAAHEVAPLTHEELVRQRLLRSLAAMGAATMDDLYAYWTWPRFPAPQQRAAFTALQREGLVTELRVEGSKRPWFIRTEDLPALKRAARARRPSAGTTLLCPFDSFLWHRERVHRLWGYFYRIEIYVPGHLRTHGYYTLPLMHEGHLVGRVDLKTHREEEDLEARHVHFEPWVVKGGEPPGARWGAFDRDAMLAGLAEALGSLAAFVGAKRTVLGRVSPGRWKSDVARALRHA